MKNKYLDEFLDMVRPAFFASSLIALVLSPIYCHKKDIITKDPVTNTYGYSCFFKKDSTIKLQDFDHDGSYDWKTVYHRVDGIMINIDVTAKESYFMKYGIQERKQFVNVVPDTTKIN